ncbi:polysaccharide deacetylase family protein [Paenibacillus thiaminolyticus]|nr:polysaccharide deacetylase [Paenibacillus thiaminolyticus]
MLLVFCFMKFTSLLETATAKQHGQSHQAAANSSGARPQGKIVYLTFDDGPSEWTGKFLDVLQGHGVKATFFMQGTNLERRSWQSNVKRAVREGHYVGGHSMTHQYKKLYEEGQFVPEMSETLSLIRDITGENPHLVRPPYGSAQVLPEIIAFYQQEGYSFGVYDDAKHFHLNFQKDHRL